jgi:hypothetical protein
MRDTYAARRPDANPAHVLVISDDGVTTMFDRDEKGNSGWDVAAQALARAGAGGTFVLNIYKQWKTANVSSKVYADLRRAEKAGWSIFSVSTWNELETFARDFSHRTYGDLRSRKAVTS